jgi:carboxylesterase type B
LLTRRKANDQFKDLCSVLDIPDASTPAERLNLLREVPAATLVEALSEMKMSNFRAVTDGDIIQAHMVQRFEDCTFAKAFVERGYRLMVGETETEVF